MSDSDFPDPDFPDLNFPFLTQALHRYCVDTNGRDDFDCDADWKTSYFERNQLEIRLYPLLAPDDESFPSVGSAPATRQFHITVTPSRVGSRVLHSH